jgi:hypothetical protein
VNLSLCFRIANNLAMIGWICLIVFPRRRWPANLLGPVIIPGIIASLYTFLIITQFHRGSGGFSSLNAVSQLFSNPALLLAGWVHYLAFDLFVGCWEVRDVRELDIGHYLVAPCLICTFLFGPAGWLIYSLLRTIARRAIDPVSCPATSSLAPTKTLSANVPDMLVDWNLRRVVMSLWVRMPRDAPNVANPGLSQAVTIPYD